MSDEADFEIQSEPSLRVVTPGAQVTYFLKPRKETSPSFMRLGFKWFALNDPKSVTLFRFSRIEGPLGRPRWENASWSFEGVHHVVCRVGDNGKFTDYVFEQQVAALKDVIASGPRLPFDKQDPDAALDAAARRIELIVAFAKQHPPATEELKKKNDEQLDARIRYRDRMKKRLASTQGKPKFVIQAEHFDSSTQRRSSLLVFAARTGQSEWKIVDWTNPMDQRTTGEYEGTGSSPTEALKAAFAEWDSDNRYPDGAIMYRADLPDVGSIRSSFETDGHSFWDSVATFFAYVGYGAAAVAGVVTLLAPVPGSQVVSVAIWTSIFSSTAAATINIGQRVSEGFSSVRANAFDVLTIAANMFGATGVLWSRGARIAVGASQAGSGMMKMVLIGQVAADGVQGVLLGVDSADEIQRITDDGSLTPTEKVDRILEILRSLAIAGTLLYINVKGTKVDLDNLNRAPKHFEGPTPEHQLKKLSDPKAELNLTQPPKVEGHTKEGKHITKAQVDQEAQTPHASGRGRNEIERQRKPAGPQKTANLDQLYRDASVAQAELNQLTTQVAAAHGGTPDIPPTLKRRGRTQEKIAADYGGDASQIVDLARSTIVFKDPAQLRKALQEIQVGGKVRRLKDRFETPVHGYRDVLINIEMKNGHIVEMQLHIESILAVKNGRGHALYEQERTIVANAKTAGRKLTLAEIQQIQKLQVEAERLYDEAYAAAAKGQ